jgi:hypothetical protein
VLVLFRCNELLEIFLKGPQENEPGMAHRDWTDAERVGIHPSFVSQQLNGPGPLRVLKVEVQAMVCRYLD